MTGPNYITRRRSKMLQDTFKDTIDLFKKRASRKNSPRLDPEDYIVVKTHLVNNMDKLLIDNKDGTFTYRRGVDDQTVADEINGNGIVQDTIITPRNISFVRLKQRPPIKLRLPAGRAKKERGVKYRLTLLEQRVYELEKRIGNGSK
jgi:hypothetical protein